jgi:Rieske Fe-S protein
MMDRSNASTAADTACESCVCRRDFILTGSAALAAIALTACGLSSTPTAPGSIPSTSVTIASQPSLANVGGVATLTVNGSPVAIVRESASSFSAFSLICPHQGNTVQPVSNGFFCPGHGAEFNIQGTWIGGQRTSSLHQYSTTYDAAAGTVTIGS